MAAFLLACPLCSQPGFQSVDSLREGLISAATRHVTCPVCQDSLLGLDKLTLHLFGHALAQPPAAPAGHDTADGATQTDEQAPGDVSYRGRKFSDAGKEVTSAGTSRTPAVEGPGNLEVELDEENFCFGKNFKNLSPHSQCNIDFAIESTLASVVMPEEVLREGNEKLKMEMNFDAVSSAGEMPAHRHGDGSAVGTPVEVPEPPSRCGVCGFSFPEEQILAMHQQLVHPASPAVPESRAGDKRQHACHLCSKSFKMRGSLMVHLRVAHGGGASLGKALVHKADPDLSSEEKKCVCPLCSKTFKKEHQLSQHMRTHEGKQWECDVCAKLFTTKYFLKKHKRLHTGEMPYACSTCGKTFTFQQSYHKHLLYHSDEKPHVCTQCERAFKELSTLHNHQRIHTGEKPFACETCGKCFRQRVSYLVHKRIHTGAMPYKCTACDRSFRYKVSQRTHKCVSQTPGAQVRQPGDLVAKLQNRSQAKVGGEADVGQRPSASPADRIQRSVQTTIPAVDVARPTACILPQGCFLEEEGKQHQHPRDPEVGIGAGTMPLPQTSEAGVPVDGSLMSPMLRAEMVAQGPLKDAGSEPSRPAPDECKLFVETSDFFTMVMSPCLLSPSERFRYLSLSPVPGEGTGVSDDVVSPVPRRQDEDRVPALPRVSSGCGKDVGITSGTSAVAGAHDGRLQSAPGCCIASTGLETINEESLKQLLYGSSTS